MEVSTRRKCGSRGEEKEGGREFHFAAIFFFLFCFALML
jgi:hypothetical protein